MQGWRVSMEDAHIAQEIRQVQDPESGEIIHLDETHYFFCVLDGHGGNKAAEYSKDHLCRILLERPEFLQYARMVGQELKSQQDMDEYPRNQQRRSKTKLSPKNNDYSRQGSSAQRSNHDLRQTSELLKRALEDSFVELDLQLLHEMVHQKTYLLPPDRTSVGNTTNNNNTEEDWGVDLIDPEMEVIPQPREKPPHSASGTTATAALVTPHLILCANVGDSRTIIDSNPLSRDHKPTLKDERQRILNATGMVNFGRVDGELAVSRAIGDFEFKAYQNEHLLEGILDMELKRKVAQTFKVSPFPEITCHYRSHDDHALILACDGIWDVMTNMQCHSFVQTLCKEGESNVGLIAEEMLDTCLKKGSRDNMTALVALMPAQAIGMGGGVLQRRKGYRTTNTKKSSLQRQRSEPSQSCCSSVTPVY